MDVNTTTGPVRGTAAGKVEAFRGIPYATAKRFRPPTPHPLWTEPRDATKPGPSAPQLQSRLAWVMGEHEPDWAEDGCLNLNVWTTDTTASKPVLVWFHGGGFTSGSGGWGFYDGGNLAGDNDIVVVTANYRLGVLGYLYRPEIGADNLGGQDQQAVLRWVRDNIAAFGGDPGQVTVGGQSAGAYSALYLAIDPATKDLVHRVLLESGPFGLAPQDPAAATKIADRFEEALDPFEATTEQILATLPKLATPGMMAPPMMPVLGGAGYPSAWPDADLSNLDVLIGYTKEEMLAFGGAPDMIGPAVPTIAKAGNGFAYRFDRSGPLGALHCVELPYLFGTFDAFKDSPMLAPEAPRTMDFGTAVANFTKTGDPGWPRYPEVRHFV